MKCQFCGGDLPETSKGNGPNGATSDCELLEKAVILCPGCGALDWSGVPPLLPAPPIYVCPACRNRPQQGEPCSTCGGNPEIGNLIGENRHDLSRKPSRTKYLTLNPSPA